MILTQYTRAILNRIEPVKENEQNDEVEEQHTDRNSPSTIPSATCHSKRGQSPTQQLGQTR